MVGSHWGHHYIVVQAILGGQSALEGARGGSTATDGQDTQCSGAGGHQQYQPVKSDHTSVITLHPTYIYHQAV